MLTNERGLNTQSPSRRYSPVLSSYVYLSVTSFGYISLSVVYLDTVHNTQYRCDSSMCTENPILRRKCTFLYYDSFKKLFTRSWLIIRRNDRWLSRIRAPKFVTKLSRLFCERWMAGPLLCRYIRLTKRIIKYPYEKIKITNTMDGKWTNVTLAVEVRWRVILNPWARCASFVTNVCVFMCKIGCAFFFNDNSSCVRMYRECCHLVQ